MIKYILSVIFIIIIIIILYFNSIQENYTNYILESETANTPIHYKETKTITSYRNIKKKKTSDTTVYEPLPNTPSTTPPTTPPTTPISSQETIPSVSVESEETFDISEFETSITIDLYNNKFGVNCFALSQEGNIIVVIPNDNNLLYLTRDGGINWNYKQLPKNNKWKNIYLLENNNFNLLVLMGLEKNIYISRFLGDEWNLISKYQGNDICYTNDLSLIYIATNKGILYNSNNGDLTFDVVGCNNECLINYNSYNGVYKFKELDQSDILNKNIKKIACNKFGNIIILNIDNMLKLAKIKTNEQENNGEIKSYNSGNRTPLYDLVDLSNMKFLCNSSPDKELCDMINNIRNPSFLFKYKISFFPSSEGELILTDNGKLYKYVFDESKSDVFEKYNLEDLNQINQFENIDISLITNDNIRDKNITEIIKFTDPLGDNIMGIIDNKQIFVQNKNKYLLPEINLNSNSEITKISTNKNGSKVLILANNKLYINIDFLNNKNYFVELEYNI